MYRIVVRRLSGKRYVPKPRAIRETSDERDNSHESPTSASQAIKLLKALQESENSPIKKSLYEQQKEDLGSEEDKESAEYQTFKENLIKKGIPDLNLFDPERVSELRHKDSSVHQSALDYTARIYSEFQNECYDDGYNEAHRRWLNDSYIRLPTTNEEGARHQDLNSHWSEHVFLEDYVNIFPPGNIRVFMDAAACGLSQNPFLTVDEKKEHMEWFRLYFLSIEDDLVNNEIIALGTLPDNPILKPDNNGMWPSEREIRKKYREMTPYGKDWYAHQFGPMSHRIKKRRAKLALLEEIDMEKDHELLEE